MNVVSPPFSAKVPDFKLVYDIGGFDGADTAHYLSLGYRVLCVEADPVQAKAISERFVDWPVKVLNLAIGPKFGVMSFYVNGALGSFDKRVGGLRRYVSVVPFDEILKQHGVPYFMKVDIEGADRYAVLPLTKDTAPQYLSFEAGKKDLDLILHAHSIGYSRFNIIRQDTQTSVSLPRMSVRWTARQRFRLWLRKQKALHALARKTKSVGYHPTSGKTPMEWKEGWRDIETMLADWSALVHSGLIESSWYDVHASR